MADNDNTPNSALDASAILTKICPKCRLEKSSDEFGKRKTKLGDVRLKPRCRKCCSIDALARSDRKRIDPETGEMRPKRIARPPSKDPKTQEERRRDRGYTSSKKFRERNRENINANGRAKYAENPDKIKASLLKYKQANPEKVKESHRKFREANREKENAKTRQRRSENPVKHMEDNRKYREKNRQKIRESSAGYYARRIQDINFQIKNILRSRLHKAVVSYGHGTSMKSAKTTELLGCTIVEFCDYLEALFEPHMAWENRNLWHVDHVIPCVLFDLTDPQQQQKCFHYSNLQPMWKLHNLSKGSKSDWEPPDHIIKATEALIQKVAIAQAA